MAWAGHVARMEPSSLQRRILFSWVENTCVVGRPQKTFGERLRHSLETMPPGVVIGMSTRRGRRRVIDRWVDYAKDKEVWRKNVVDNARWDRYGARPRYR